MPEIADSLIIGVEQPDGGYWMALFVALDPGAELDEARARGSSTRSAPPPPRATCPTRSCTSPPSRARSTGKKLEVPIKRLFMGADPATALNRSAVADPAALDAFVALAAARSATLRH